VTKQLKNDFCFGDPKKMKIYPLVLSKEKINKTRFLLGD